MYVPKTNHYSPIGASLCQETLTRELIAENLYRMWLQQEEDMYPIEAMEKIRKEIIPNPISLHLEWNGREVVALTEEKDENHEAKVFDRDEKVSFSFSVEDIHLFDASTDSNLLWEENNG